MTAIIGILNKSAVGIAADSAVTVGSRNNYKVYNHANKIFNLSIGNPIAIMIYNSAEFAGIPWETVIKQYREYSKNRKFEFTYQYRDDFIKYLKTYNKDFDDLIEQQTIVDFVSAFLNLVEERLEEELDERFPNPSDWIKLSPDKRIDVYLESIVKVLLLSKKYVEKYSKLTTLKGGVQFFKKRHKSLIEEIANQCFSNYNLSKNRKLLRLTLDIVSELFFKDIYLEAHTGLVFTGFGDREVFPSLFSVKIGGIFNKQFRYSLVEDESSIISHSNSASIAPFAQTDIMRTFVEGVDPYVRDSVPEAFNSALIQFRDFIVSNIDNSNPTERRMKQLLDLSIPKVVEALVNRLEELRANSHIMPMLSTIGSLSKQDMAELAESLINLTYLKRRASFSEESVGGPIDVAVITKGDGFIWIKRKNYFKSELNINYISKVKNNNR